jgi:hypothetical protein
MNVHSHHVIQVIVMLAGGNRFQVKRCIEEDSLQQVQIFVISKPGSLAYSVVI